MPGTLMRILLLVLTLWLGTACAPELDSDHPGWKQPACWGCHSKGSTHHAGDLPYQCADCHGTNGAPAGHGGATPCTTCHGAKHGEGFPDPAACQTCHAD